MPAQSQQCLHSRRVIHKRGTMGKPDQKDLNENMAATQGLSHMITDCKKLFQVSGCSMSSPALPFQDATSRRCGLTSGCWSVASVRGEIRAPIHQQGSCHWSISPESKAQLHLGQLQVASCRTYVQGGCVCPSLPWWDEEL